MQSAPRNDLRAEIVRRGLQFKAVAVDMNITPSHLSAVLSGRSTLTGRVERDLLRAIERLSAEPAVA